MLRQGCVVLMLVLCSAVLTGCLSDVWTGATLVYDRHNIYKKISDFQLAANVNRALYKDALFKCTDCSIEVAVFNGDILLVGHVPTKALRAQIQSRMATISDYRRLFIQVAVGHLQDNLLDDGWITAKIRSGIFADAEIDPHSFKVVTSERVVYLMGDVIPSEALRVIRIARETEGVKRVVKLFKYYNLSDHAIA